MTDPTDYPPETYEAAIAEALIEGKVKTAVDILKMMAVHHPRQAQAALDELTLGIKLARGEAE